MGAVGEDDAPGNQWREANDFPPTAQPQSLYLTSGGGLKSQLPNEQGGSTQWQSDPARPMEIPGTSFPGAKDARDFEKQADVRTFTTEPLEAPVEWTGRIRAEIYLSSTARDTDLIVRVSDVYPDGRSILLVDYPWRVRYREGFDREVLLTPGQVARVAFDVGWISQIFNRGHRIRVTIASTGSPLYEPNPQTGDPLTIEFPKETVVATNTLHHEARHPSRLLVPRIE
jgi:putative CocE/NonD family hydrolase